MTATKEEKAMGRTTAVIKIENSADIANNTGFVRTIEVEALVDTGASFLCLNSDLIEKLGLTAYKEMNVDTAHGISPVKVYTNALLTIMGRKCSVDVVEVKSKTKALIGYIPLESLDLMIDPKARKLIPNPEHPEGMLLDLL